MRAGVVTGSIGLGATLLAMLMFALVRNSSDPDTLPMITLFGGLAIVCFAIGLGLVLNGLWFTRVPKSLKGSSAANEPQNLLDSTSPPQLPPAGDRLDLPRSA